MCNLYAITKQQSAIRPMFCVANAALGSIVLKNPNFGLDHNLKVRSGAWRKFRQGGSARRPILRRVGLVDALP
ncbi:MAG: hypothetical protein ABSC25_19285 [Roseiarcus sp.]|jgi:hypothetical protein